MYINFKKIEIDFNPRKYEEEEVDVKMNEVKPD